MTARLVINLTALGTLISCSSGQTNQNTQSSSRLTEQKTNTSKPMTQKKFKEADNTAVFTTKFVVIDNKDITQVHHDKDDGAWQFFSDDKFDDFRKVAKLVALGLIIKIDSTILELAEMPTGYVAHRKHKGDKWTIEKQQ